MEDFPLIWKALPDPDLEEILPDFSVCPGEARLPNLREGFHHPHLWLASQVHI
jgi:hypothetical protein